MEREGGSYRLLMMCRRRFFPFTLNGREVMEIPTFCPPQRISDKRRESCGLVIPRKKEICYAVIQLNCNVLSDIWDIARAARAIFKVGIILLVCFVKEWWRFTKYCLLCEMSLCHGGAKLFPCLFSLLFFSIHPNFYSRVMSESCLLMRHAYAAANAAAVAADFDLQDDICPFRPQIDAAFSEEVSGQLNHASLGFLAL